MIDRVLAVLEGVRRGVEGNYLARCPAHDDREASLSVKASSAAADWPLFKCFAGCRFEDIRAALEAKGVTRERLVPVETMLREIKRTVYDIRDPEGALICQHVRIDRNDGSKTFRWQMPDGAGKLSFPASRLLYRVERLREVPGPVVVCEGEQATEAAEKFWAVALGTVQGASSAPDRTALEPLRGRLVFLWPDNDDPGREHMRRVGANLYGIASSVRLIEWTGANPKDDAADFVRSGNGASELATLIEEATEIVTEPALPPGVVAVYDRNVIRAVTERTDGIYTEGKVPGAISTGIPALDRALRGGLIPGEVYLVGAVTGGGKTTLMQTLAVAAAKLGPVLFVTPEMTVVSMVEREVIRRSGVTDYQIAPWSNRDDETREAAIGRRTLAQSAMMDERPPILLFDKADATMEDVADAATQIQGLQLIIVDYAQQIADTTADRARYLQVAEVGARSVDLAKLLKIPVVVASQVNTIRGKDGAIQGYTFRETSMLEHKAAVVMILERTDSIAERMTERPFYKPIPARLFCTKNRHGFAFASVEIEWMPALFTIGEPSREEEPEARPSVPQEMRLPLGDE